ncbi:C40 family peptidase [Clostridium porci]|uniref:NlpC/P60 family protein n=1 Tax=Clostridium porci TaxID=2605778 RepID=A0A7X2NKH6_9CLOT|nr:NlpC/P60 family protein [Clostridium porci]MSS36525.1 NlpC/P60 family protein [Clostridium porci]
MKRKMLIIAALFATLSAGTAFAQEYETAEWTTETVLLNADGTAANDTSEEAIDFAMSKLGYPYSMERRDSGKAYDCSSLIYYSYKDAGLDLSHGGATTAAEMARGLAADGSEISVSAWEPGDLIFYSYKKNGRYRNISHVSMYVGDGRQIEASYSKQKVATRPVSLSSVVMVGRPNLAMVQ